MGEEIGHCQYCGASLWRDDYGKVHARKPAPGCLCSAPEEPESPPGEREEYLWMDR
jgi:hypothetical protein